MKLFFMLPTFLSVVAAEISDGACGPKPPTVPELYKDLVSILNRRLQFFTVDEKYFEERREREEEVTGLKMCAALCRK